MKYVLSILIITAVRQIVFSQEFDYSNLKVTVSAGDSTIKTVVSAKNLLINVNSECLYYWYGSGKITCNYGGYSGSLVNGKWEVFDKSQHLIESGKFVMGLKSGKWFRWFPTGKISSISNYKRSKLDGDVICYSDKGAIVAKYSYINGVLSGASYLYTKDSIQVVHYFDGIVLTQPQRSDKWFSVFKKRNVRKINKSMQKDTLKKTAPKVPVLIPIDTVKQKQLSKEFQPERRSINPDTTKAMRRLSNNRNRVKKIDAGPENTINKQ